MSKHQITIDFRHVDVSMLQKEDDFRKEAKKLLPHVLIQVGEAMGEETWNALQKKLKGTGMKPTVSSTEKRKFVKEAGKNYEKEASSKDKKELEDYIVQKLREHKEATT